MHLWKVTEVTPLKKIVYDWKYEGNVGDSSITFELVENEGRTTLRVSHEVTESLPDDIPELERESGVAGWNYFINDRLISFLDQNVE